MVKYGSLKLTVNGTVRIYRAGSAPDIAGLAAVYAHGGRLPSIANLGSAGWRVTFNSSLLESLPAARPRSVLWLGDAAEDLHMAYNSFSEDLCTVLNSN